MVKLAVVSDLNKFISNQSNTLEIGSNNDFYKSVTDKISYFETGFNSDYVLKTGNISYNDKYSCYILLTPGLYDFDKKETADSTLFILPSYPDDVNDNVDAQWGMVSVLGRPVPVATFTGTGYRSVSFSFDIHREMLGDTNISTVEDFLFGIKQAVYPSDVDFTNSNKSYTGFVPRIATVKLGAFFVKGYITSVNHTWKKPLIYNEELGMYQYQLCTVGLSINGVDMSQFSK